MDRKKELKDAYKQIKQPMGVFCIKNPANGKMYVGKSMNLRAAENRLAVDPGFFDKTEEFARDWKTLGRAHFVFEVLEYLETKDDDELKPETRLEAMEKKWLEKTMPFGDAGYNKNVKAAGR